MPETTQRVQTLPADRIAQLLDAEAVSVKAAAHMQKHIDAIPDLMPCEDFAADTLRALLQIHDDTRGVTAEAAAELLDVIESLETLQRDLFSHSVTINTHLRAIEDELQAWVAS